VRHVRDDLTALLDGALDPARKAEVEAHLSACDSCRGEHDRLARVLGFMATLPPPPEPSSAFNRTFWKRVDAEPPRQRGLMELMRSARWPVAGALAGAVAAAAVVLVSHHGALRDQRELAAHLDLFENYEVVASVGAVKTAEDAEVIAHLDELAEGRP